MDNDLQQTSHITFSPEMKGSGEEDRARLSFGEYKSSDGVSVSTRILTFSSETEAVEKLNSIVASATRVLENDKKTYNESNINGRRVLLFNDAKKPTGMGAKLVFLKSNKVYILDSTSLEHLRLFEESYLPIR